MEKFEFRVHGGKVCCETVRDASGAIDYTRLCADCRIVARRAGIKALGSSGSPEVRAGTGPAKLRAACEKPHTLEQRAAREAHAVTITRVWGAKVAALMDLEHATCDQLARWAAAARKEEQKIAALRAAASLPPKLRAAAEVATANVHETRAAASIYRNPERSFAGKIQLGAIRMAAAAAKADSGPEVRSAGSYDGRTPEGLPDPLGLHRPAEQPEPETTGKTEAKPRAAKRADGLSLPDPFGLGSRYF